jgi:hypothetical protein
MAFIYNLINKAETSHFFWLGKLQLFLKKASGCTTSIKIKEMQGFCCIPRKNNKLFSEQRECCHQGIKDDEKSK